MQLTDCGDAFVRDVRVGQNELFELWKGREILNVAIYYWQSWRKSSCRVSLQGKGTHVTKVCPHCGEPLPVVRDAFCSECRGPLTETSWGADGASTSSAGVRHQHVSHISEYFTMPGRILVLITIVLAVGGPWLLIGWLYDSLPTGNYPLLFFALPIWIGLALLFALTSAVLRWLGVPVFQDRSNPESLGGDADRLPRGPAD